MEEWINIYDGEDALCVLCDDSTINIIVIIIIIFYTPGSKGPGG